MFGKSNKSSFYDIGRSPEAADYLASQLERLMALPLTTRDEIEKWYEECDMVQGTLKHKFPKFEPFHEVWHFFDDADIRGRDSGYRDRQHRLISDYIQQLRDERQDAS